MSYTREVFDYVDDIPDFVWNALPIDNKYLSKWYLKTLETHNYNKIRFNYLVLHKRQKLAAFLMIQIVEFDFTTSNVSSNSNEFVQKSVYRLSCLIKRDYVKLMICGNAFLSGEYGHYLALDVDQKKLVKELSKGIQYVIQSDKYLKKWVDIILVKDFEDPSLERFKWFKRQEYTPIQVDPKMVLYIQPEWKTFEDYLAALKSKFRVKAKKAYKTSANLMAVDFDEDQILTNKEELTALYEQVIEKSDFNPATLNLATYASLKKMLGDKFVFRAYYLEYTLVGFMSGMVSNGSFDAHFVGFDYSLNKEHAIYSRMLYDYVTLGIAKGVKQVNFGRTASEIKSALGATPEPLTIYVRHRKSLANFLFKPIIRMVKPKGFKQHFPFKKSLTNTSENTVNQPISNKIAR